LFRAFQKRFHHHATGPQRLADLIFAKQPTAWTSVDSKNAPSRSGNKAFFELILPGKQRLMESDSSVS
jgi:alpha-ketoglutarate-dependent taurine dioxygenase